MVARDVQLYLVVRAPNGDVREIPFGDEALVIGRDESADIRVDDRKVSRRHAAFKLVDGEPWVEDLGSSNGVRLNDSKIPKRARMSTNDVVRVGGFHMSLKRVGAKDSDRPSTGAVGTASAVGVTGDSAPGTAPVARARVIERGPRSEPQPRLIGIDGPTKGRTFDVQRGENIIGRLEECDVPILDGSVSRQHARVVFTRNRVTVTDLGSSNGVFVNDLRVDMAELAEADILRVGNVSFNVRMPPGLSSADPAPLQTRARARQVAQRPWLNLGAVGLILAILAMVTALVLQMRRNGSFGLIAEHLGMTSTVAAAGPDLLDDDGVPVLTAGEVPLLTAPAAAPNAPDAQKADAPPASPAVPPPEGAASAEVPLAQTATSPYSRRGPDGLPVNLPTVDPDFDLDRFASERMAEAVACEKAADFPCVRRALAALVERDPINTEARALLDRVRQIEQSNAAMAAADRYVARGDYARALRALAEAPQDGPRAQAIRQRSEELKERAIDEELTLAAREARRVGSWKRAHRRFKYVLQLDPQSPVALSGLRSLERKMRRRKMAFAAYRPPSAAGRASTPTTDDEALRRQYGDDEELVQVAQAYARGALDRAARLAKRLSRRSRGRRAVTAAAMNKAIIEVRRRYKRTRTEISNDPDQAWAMLIELERYERRILPRDRKSFVVRELEVSLSEAFADRGKGLFEDNRYEDAFQRWESGFKLDPTNPKIIAGLKRLEARAEALAQEAELAAKRGADDVCNRWKRITRMTRSGAEIHQRARKRAIQSCR